jgi:hypothetical protein
VPVGHCPRCPAAPLAHCPTASAPQPPTAPLPQCSAAPGCTCKEAGLAGTQTRTEAGTTASRAYRAGPGSRAGTPCGSSSRSSACSSAFQLTMKPIVVDHLHSILRRRRAGRPRAAPTCPQCPGPAGAARGPRPTGACQCARILLRRW